MQSRGSAFGKDNVIPEHAIVSGDLRALSAEQFAAGAAGMTAIVAQSLPHTSATIDVRRRLSAAGADRRQPRSCWRCTTRPAATSGWAPSRRSTPIGPAPRTSRSWRRGADDPRRHRHARRWRPHRQRDCRSVDVSRTNQPRGGVAVSPVPRRPLDTGDSQSHVALRCPRGQRSGSALAPSGY